MDREGQTARLFALGNYQRVAETGAPEEWQTHAALGLMGKTAAALEGLERFDHDDARFYAAVARWIDGEDAAAERALASIPTIYAQNLLRLIRLPRIRVLAQLWETKEGYWGLVDGISEDPRFRVQNLESRPYLDVHRLYDQREPPHFYIAAQAEWHLIPPNIRELPCPIFTQTGDPDIHVQVVYPWLRLFDEVVTTSFDEWEDAWLLCGVPTSVFPKLFSIPLPQPHLDPFKPRIHHVTLTGAWFHPYQPEKARLVHQIARMPGVKLVLYDGYLDRASYYRLLASSKVVVCFSRYTGCLPSRGLESLSMGCATLIPRGNVWSHFVGEGEGVFQYDPAGTDLPDVIRKILDGWPELLPRLRRGSALVRQEFCRPRVASQYLRYLTFLAAKPRGPRPPVGGPEPRQKRLVFWRGGFPGAPELREQLRNESLERWSATREVRSPQVFIDITRELALLAAEIAEQAALHPTRTGGGQTVLLPKVVRFYRMGMDRFPRSLVLRFNFIRVAFHLGRPQDVTAALAVCRQSVETPAEAWDVDPLDDVFPYDFFSAWFNYRAYLDLVTAHLKSGKAVKGDLVHLILASLHNYLGHYQDAPSHFATAVRLDPTFPRYQLNLAMSLLGRGEVGDRQTAKQLLIQIAESSWLFHEAYALLTEHFGEEMASSPVLAGISDAGFALVDAVSLTSRAHPFDVWGSMPLQPPTRDAAVRLPPPSAKGAPGRREPDAPSRHPPPAPLVSALVTVYEGERFMRGLLEDLEGQSIADHLEIVIADSGSPQNERTIVEEFQWRHDNIVYLRTEERENSHAALNRAIRLARGRYLTLANVDDRHRPDAFERLAAVLESKPDVALVYADSAITDQENATFDAARIIGHLRLPDFEPRLLFRGCAVGPQPMWRRTLHERYGLFDPEYLIAGDYEFWLRIARTERFVHIPEVLGLYLMSPTSNERVNRIRRHQETERARRTHWPVEWGELPAWDADYNDMRVPSEQGEATPPAVPDPDMSRARQGLTPGDLEVGQRALDRQAWPEAATAFIRALEGDRNCAAARSGLGLALMALDDPEEGLAQLHEAVRLEPSPDLVCNLADGLIHVGRAEEAKRLLEGIPEVAPNHAGARSNLTQLLAAQGNGGTGETALCPGVGPPAGAGPLTARSRTDRPGGNGASLRASTPRNPSAAGPADLLESGAHHLAAKRWPEAVEAFRAALAVAPDLAEARAALGSALLVMGRLPEAMAELRQAGEGLGSSGAWNDYGWACAVAGNADEARAAFITAIERDPTNLEPQRNLAALFETLGMPREAAAAYDLILLTVPQDPEALAGKARCAPAVAATPVAAA